MELKCLECLRVGKSDVLRKGSPAIADDRSPQGSCDFAKKHLRAKHRSCELRSQMLAVLQTVRMDRVAAINAAIDYTGPVIDVASNRDDGSEPTAATCELMGKESEL